MGNKNTKKILELKSCGSLELHLSFRRALSKTKSLTVRPNRAADHGARSTIPIRRVPQQSTLTVFVVSFQRYHECASTHTFLHTWSLVDMRVSGSMTN